MPQVTEFLPLGADPRGALLALVTFCRETPAAGQSLAEFRGRARLARLWDKDRPHVLLRLLGVPRTPITASPFMTALAGAGSEERAFEVIADRVWELNPLLFKTVCELLEQRAYGKDELSKLVGSFAYRGQVPSRPDLESYYQVLVATGVARPVGIALTQGPQAARFAAHVAAFDVDEFLAADQPLEDLLLSATEPGEDAAPAASAVPSSVEEKAAPSPVGGTSTGSLPGFLRHLTSVPLPSPQGRERPVPVSRFVGGFSDEVLAETTRRIEAWSVGLGAIASPYQPDDFGLDAESWVEASDEVLYRTAVAAALVFRFEADRADVLRAYRSLDDAGVLTDLFHGTVPETLPANVDARALMLASLAARRCAEHPELAAALERESSAAGALNVLDAALGRGLFRIELFWILSMLGRLGVVRWDDLAALSALPHRLVRDTLFRLGFLSSPYATDVPALVTAARAARRAAGSDSADEIVARFAIAWGCAYDCPHRRTCDVPCRERLE